MWLVEGFTTLMEYTIAGKLHPDWRDVDFFNIDHLQAVFRDDQSNTAPAMTESVETIDEIESNFGIIAYDKAGCVLRMFQQAIGEDIFREALSHYLKVNQRKIVLPSDFHLAIEQVLATHDFNDFKFTEAFITWELQKGYPVIHVSYDKETKEFRVTQKRFFINSELEDENNSKWTIPLSFSTSTNPTFDSTISHYFEHETNEKVIAIEDEPEWFVFNNMQLGYYRVNYDFENWHNLVVVLNGENYQQIHVLNRAQLVDDAMSLAQSGSLDYNLAVGILMYLKEETDYAPWASALFHLKHVSEIFGGRHSEINVSRDSSLNHLTSSNA